ncbi:unnamed protein product [Clonostachys solani]|uniref:Uncharacterized protein n=1 Tax=Clonostachys solani TaxID=160281 RepID=A0A9P0EHE3_9HYPO|nr:unnamed protein product [Clonostachys solani]
MSGPDLLTRSTHLMSQPNSPSRSGKARL